MRAGRNKRWLALAGPAWVLCLVLLVCGQAVAGPIRSPHEAESCLDCHRSPELKGNNAQGVPTIIVPEGEDPHKVLLNTCSGCHPQELPAFWLMILPKRRPQAQSAAPAPQAPGGTAYPNPHDSLECAKCHRQKVAFGTVTGGEKDLLEKTGDLSDFCQKCHGEIVARHFPRGNVPMGGGCTSCHLVHGATALTPALRGDYYSFIRETREVNPHGGSLFCLTCHASKPMAGEEMEFIVGPKEMDRLCLRCHPGVDHHPVGRAQGPGTWKIEFLKYPLVAGKIGCVTCHDPHGGTPGQDASGYFLRGEPYSKMTDFCLKCHEDNGWQKLNAHDQLTPDGELIPRSCLFCHAKVPDTALESMAGRDEFNDSFTAVCNQCHDDFPHPDVNHMVLPTGAMVSDIRLYEKKRVVSLPLDFDGKITCVTCHNPHEKGLLKGPDAVGADEENRLRLTTFNEICTPCHGRH